MKIEGGIKLDINYLTCFYKCLAITHTLTLSSTCTRFRWWPCEQVDIQILMEGFYKDKLLRNSKNYLFIWILKIIGLKTREL